jgi:hypothetical protein
LRAAFFIYEREDDKMARRAQEFFSGTGNFSKRFSGDREELVVINDDATASLTFVAGGTNFTLKAGEVFDEEINPFSSIDITATGSFRGYVREDA